MRKSSRNLAFIFRLGIVEGELGEQQKGGAAIAVIGAICCDPRSGVDKYSPTNERKN